MTLHLIRVIYVLKCYVPMTDREILVEQEPVSHLIWQWYTPESEARQPVICRYTKPMLCWNWYRSLSLIHWSLPSFLQVTIAWLLRSALCVSTESLTISPAVARIDIGLLRIAGVFSSGVVVDSSAAWSFFERSSIFRGRNDHARLIAEFEIRLAGIQSSFLVLIGDTTRPGPSRWETINSSPACNFPQSAANLTRAPGTI